MGALDKLKRALVALIVSMARAYNCGVDIKRESSDEEVRSAYRRLSRHVHPDRAGRTVLRAQRTQHAASRFALGLFNVCKEVKAKKGAASRG